MGGKTGYSEDALEGVLSASKTELAGKAAVTGKVVVLVMQGGGAQAAYEGGVYEALHKAGIEPDWVIGTSIGAINGSIIAGNEVKPRLKRLREFWSRVESRPTWPAGPMFGNAANQLTTLLILVGA
jgi:predicted acylesterase/phospholipase RssA